MWYPYRYLIAGRTEWEIIWFDPAVISDPRAYFEEKLGPKLGPLIGFEPVAGMPPKTGNEMAEVIG